MLSQNTLLYLLNKIVNDKTTALDNNGMSYVSGKTLTELHRMFLETKSELGLSNESKD